jgi:drug/metabolite transporter (DMT)-like permease
LAAIAGIGFGGFFILLGQVDSGALFVPLAVTSCSASAVALLAMAISRTRLPSPRRNPTAVLAGVLDAAGVVAYLVAIRWIRLDVAAVLGSLYPAITVLLFRVLMKEAVNRTQWVGLAVCVAAIALIAL